jgi:hypothetical protein
MRWFAILIAAWFTSPALLADEPAVWVPGIAQRNDSYLMDLELTLRAREALTKDKALAGLNLVVNVRQRVVILRGPMTTPDLEAQARARLALVPGLSDVRSELCLEVLDSPPYGKPQEKLKLPSSTANPVSVRVPRAQAALVLRHPDEGWTPGRSSDPPRARSLGDAIEALRLANDRLNGLVVDLRGTLVSLKGRVRHFEDVAEFAQAIARLPGVQSVRLDEVEVAPRP